MTSHPLSMITKGVITFCLLVGIIALVYAFVFADPLRAWGSFLVSLFFFFTLALGGVALTAMQDVIGARWGRPIKRLHESFASFLPLATLLFLIFFVCIKLNIGRASEVYSWIADHDLLHHYVGKRDWLIENFMLIRVSLLLLIIVGLSYWQLSPSLRADRLLLAGDEAGALQLAKKNRARLRYWSAPLLVIYALCFTFICFDVTMSLAPKWFSTLWGGWNFSIMMQTLFAFLLLYMFAAKNSPLGQHYGRKQFHDVGKLLFGFTIFFAYLTYAHVLTYWYGNVPEEAEYFIHRIQQPWLTLVIITPLFNFVIPMIVLIPKANKWTATFAIPVCVMVIVAQWMTQVIVVAPQLDHGHSWQLPLIEFGVFLGFLGLFMACVSLFSRRLPMLAVSDPLLK